jgi:diguanylate cyclase (GGDEF)-like protein
MTAEGAEPTLRRPSERRSVRVKILSLALAAALMPSLFVGAASYYTAQSILLEKTSGQLATRTDSVVRHVESWVAERREDLQIFANSQIVAGRLPSAANGTPGAAAPIRDYLQQVQERFPLYHGLEVVDPTGRPIARAGSAELPVRSRDTSVAQAQIVWLEGVRGRPLLLLEQPIGAPEEVPVGALRAVASFDSLLQRLSAEAALDAGELRLATTAARATITRRGALPVVWEATSSGGGLDRCRAQAPLVLRYRTQQATDVLGSCRVVADVRLGVIVELPAESALSSSRQLRNRLLAIVSVGALLVMGLGYALVVRLVRPIEALIEGARAVSGGDYAHEVRVSSRDELGYLGAVFNQMTRALRASHGELEQLSRTDQLTGLFNRRHLDIALDDALDRARREQTPLSVLMLDLDHFKAFNDRFGHPEGDALLRAVAALLREQLRPSDTVARYGGEEFTILLPRSPSAEAVRIAERLRDRLAEGLGPTGVPTTGSFGIATWPEDASTAADLIATADAALYEAKRRGRDRIALAGVLEPAG